MNTADCPRCEGKSPPWHAELVCDPCKADIAAETATDADDAGMTVPDYIGSRRRVFYDS